MSTYVLFRFYHDKTDCASIMHCTRLFRTLILTGCRLVTRTVKVTNTDLEHGLKSYFIVRIKHDSFLSLCIGENHEKIIELRNDY